MEARVHLIYGLYNLNTCEIRSARAQREIRQSSLAERGLIDYDRVDDLWAAHRAGQEWSFQLWNLYNVSAWYDHWVAGRELVA